jgi:photosystem II stability/assembly factor-like uncharacterized protein
MMDAQSGWAVLSDSQTKERLLLRTSDGGIHWKDVTPQDSTGRKIIVNQAYASAPMPLSSAIAWVLPTNREGKATTDEMFRTTDGGRTWRSLPNPGHPSVVGPIFFMNPREGWLIASIDSYMGNHLVDIYYSTDGGGTWKKVASVTPEDQSSGLSVSGGKASITFRNSTTGWVTVDRLDGGAPFLYVTRDGGRTWRPVSMPLPPEAGTRWRALSSPPKFFTDKDGIVPVWFGFLPDPVTDSVRVLYTTHDGGTTWKYQQPFPRGEVVMVDIDHAWAWDGVVLRVTSDSGRTWNELPKNPLFGDVRQFNFVSPQIGWAIRSTPPLMLRTSDGGFAWTPVSYAISRQ